MRLRFLFFILFYFVFGFVFAGEYTDSFTIITEGAGYSKKKDPVEAFNNAIKNAKSSAIGQASAYIRGMSKLQDAVLEEEWIEKSSNAQVTNLVVKEYKFEGRDTAWVKIKATITYLNVPRFMHEYDKTVFGAFMRTATFPGWGQFYNKTYITGILYGLFFYFFYYKFVVGEQAIATSRSYTDKVVPYEIESDREIARRENMYKYQVPAFVFWLFAVSDAVASRINAKKALEGLRKMFRLRLYNYKREFVDRETIVDFLVYQFTF